MENGRTIPRDTPSVVRKFAAVGTGKIPTAILNSAKTDEARALVALHRALIHPNIQKLRKLLDFKMKI
jgi:hypothetical protein